MIGKGNSSNEIDMKQTDVDYFLFGKKYLETNKCEALAKKKLINLYD